jgi:hypothetical protein
MARSVATAGIGPFRLPPVHAILVECPGAALLCATALHSANRRPIFISRPVPGRALAGLSPRARPAR